MIDPVTGAVIGGAGLIQAGGSIWGGILQRNAAKDAARVMQEGAMSARRTLTDAERRATGYLDPYRMAGDAATGTLLDRVSSPQERLSQLNRQKASLQEQIAMLRKPIDVATFAGSGRQAQQAQQEQSARADQLESQMRLLDQEIGGIDPNKPKMGPAPAEASPWYQFQADLFQRDANRRAAAMGTAGSGAEMESFRRGLLQLGAQETERQWERQFRQQEQDYGVLTGLAGRGTQAALGEAQLVGNLAGNIASTDMAAAQAQAAGIRGAADANAGIITGVGNAINSTAALALNQSNWNKFQDALLKKNTGGASPTPTTQTASNVDWDTAPVYDEETGRVNYINPYRLNQAEGTDEYYT